MSELDPFQGIPSKPLPVMRPFERCIADNYAHISKMAGVYMYQEGRYITDVERVKINSLAGSIAQCMFGNEPAGEEVATARNSIVFGKMVGAYCLGVEPHLDVTAYTWPSDKLLAKSDNRESLIERATEYTRTRPLMRALVENYRNVLDERGAYRDVVLTAAPLTIRAVEQGALQQFVEEVAFDFRWPGGLLPDEPRGPNDPNG